MTATPKRLRLSRRKGFDLQAASRALNGLACFNGARPGALGNPFVVGKHGTRAECVDLHARLLAGYLTISFDRECVQAQRDHRATVLGFVKSDQHRGKNGSCWCKGKPCHVDTLLVVFNR